ncbi:MAG: potassium transporter [Lysobacter sp.]|nr:potassium transporter [Lysobacter sp.]
MKQKVHRVFPVLHVLSVAILLFSPAFLVPFTFSVALADGFHAVFAVGFLAAALTGLFLYFLTRGRYRRELQPRDGFLLVTLVWTTVPTLATIPLLLAIPGMSFTDAYFEAVSGLTTSGATVLTGLDGLAPSINIWRTLMVWLGGMGIIVLAVAILPMLGIGGSQLFKAESPGCMKDTKLTPRIEETAKGLWGVYAAVTLTCIASLHLAGMTWVDAVVHGFSTMGLGGFSSHDASFAYFNSATIEAVTTFFMLAASLNFAIHFLALRRRSLGPYAEDTEARWVLVWLGASCAGIAVFLLAKGTYPDFWTALRYASFNVVSIASTTGFASVDFAQWPVFAPVWMIFLSSFVTSSGSTGGGIKIVRALVLLKQSFRELTRIIHPSAVQRIKLGTQVIENNVIFAVLAFMLMYGGTIITMTMLLLASGLDNITAVTAVIACINNMGPGLGQVGPSSNYQGLTDFQTWVCTATMLLGRLEMFPILVLFTPAFWRK